MNERITNEWLNSLLVSGEIDPDINDVFRLAKEVVDLRIEIMNMAVIDTCNLGHKFGRLPEYRKCPVCLEVGLAAARAAGPVMPEKPDYGILQYIIEAGHNYKGEENMTSRDRAERAWDKIRRTLSEVTI